MERQMGRTAEVVREAVVIVLLGTLAWLAAEAVLAVRDARRIIDEVPDVVDAALAREAELTRGELADESALWRRLVASESGRARAAAVAESAAWRVATEAQLTGARVDLRDAIDRQGAALVATVRPTTEAATAALDEYRMVPRIIGARLDPWTDCKGNGACWQAQTTALLGASRVTAGEASRAARSINAAVPSIVASVDTTTANVARLTRPDSLKMRILKILAPIAGGAVFGAIK
jgi:hypothetical protein